MGQSAGAHIAACTILNQVIKESGEKESTTWSVSQIKAYFGISGGQVFSCLYMDIATSNMSSRLATIATTCILLF